MCTTSYSCEIPCRELWEDITLTLHQTAFISNDWPNETQVACISCLPGYYLQLDGGEKSVGGGPYACQQCEAGTFSSSAGATACDLCSLGTYQPGSGKSSCLQCDLTEAAPSAQTTVMEGSYHRDQCVACLPGI